MDERARGVFVFDPGVKSGDPSLSPFLDELARDRAGVEGTAVRTGDGEDRLDRSNTVSER